MDDQQMREHLSTIAKQHGGHSAFGTKYGFSRQFVQMVIAGRAKPGDRLLEVVGLRRVVTTTYETVNPPGEN